jgi:hypothetical protein
VDLGHGQLGPLAAARLVSGRGFAPGQADANVAVADSAYAASHGLKTGPAVTIAGTRFTLIGLVRQALTWHDRWPTRAVRAGRRR